MGARLLPGSPALMAALAAALAAAVVLGCCWQRSGLFARPINGAAVSAGQIALTFDDGPDPCATPAVLQLLADHGQRATFFVIGAQAQRHPDLVRRIAAEGHELANHSFHHRWSLGLWPPRRLAADLSQTQQVIAALGLPVPVHFRPPAAVLTPRIARGSKLAGLRLVGHTVRAFDRAPGRSADAARQRLIKGLRPGAIVLLHDSSEGVGLDLLPPLLSELRRQGLTSVPLHELLAHA